MYTLKNPRILISNDDGIDAIGIKVLEKAALRFSSDVWVVAPLQEQSGKGRALSVARPVMARRVDERHIGLDGTPTDCVFWALQHLLKRKKPDLLLTGVNRGRNLSTDVTYSGTVSAAMEGTVHGIPSIAFSLAHVGGGHHAPGEWDTAAAVVPEIVEKLSKVKWPEHVLMSVNIPDVSVKKLKGFAAVQQGHYTKAGDNVTLAENPWGIEQYWLFGGSNNESESKTSDYHACIKEHKVTVTPLSIDLTHEKALKALKAAL